jgi:hypothetical protein
MKKPQEPLDAEIHEMLDFYWKAAQRSDAAAASAVAPVRRKAAASRKLSALRAIRHASRENARAAGRGARRIG